MLRYLEILEDGRPSHAYELPTLKDVVYLKGNYTGCWYPEKRAGDKFLKGEKLGAVKDYFGNVLDEVKADSDGVILYQTASLNVLKGGPMIAYARI